MVGMLRSRAVPWPRSSSELRPPDMPPPPPGLPLPEARSLLAAAGDDGAAVGAAGAASVVLRCCCCWFSSWGPKFSEPIASESSLRTSIVERPAGLASTPRRTCSRLPGAVGSSPIMSESSPRRSPPLFPAGPLADPRAADRGVASRRPTRGVLDAHAAGVAGSMGRTGAVGIWLQRCAAVQCARPVQGMCPAARLAERPLQVPAAAWTQTPRAEVILVSLQIG